MISRVGLVGVVAFVAVLVGTTAAAHQPPRETAMFVVRHDPRLCPSPMCGGYWVAQANAARTRCQDGLPHLRCYVARAVDANGNPVADLAEEGLVRGALDIGRDDLGELVATAAYVPAGAAREIGRFYRLVDTGIRCVRAPCYSYRATQVNGATGTRVSGVDLVGAKTTASERARAEAALRTKSGLYARGGFARGADGGRVFEATRLYLRTPLPRA